MLFALGVLIGACLVAGFLALRKRLRRDPLGWIPEHLRDPRRYVNVTTSPFRAAPPPPHAPWPTEAFAKAMYKAAEHGELDGIQHLGTPEDPDYEKDKQREERRAQALLNEPVERIIAKDAGPNRFSEWSEPNVD